MIIEKSVDIFKGPQRGETNHREVGVGQYVNSALGLGYYHPSKGNHGRHKWLSFRRIILVSVEDLQMDKPGVMTSVRKRLQQESEEGSGVNPKSDSTRMSARVRSG